MYGMNHVDRAMIFNDRYRRIVGNSSPFNFWNIADSCCVLYKITFSYMQKIEP